MISLIRASFSHILPLSIRVQACSQPIALIYGDLYKNWFSQCPPSKDSHPVRGRKMGRAENSSLFTLLPSQLSKSMEKLQLGPYHHAVFDTQRAAPSGLAELNPNLGINAFNRFLVALAWQWTKKNPKINFSFNISSVHFQSYLKCRKAQGFGVKHNS